ncbi:hypothetical protein HYW74_02030 [Candidatus Pacearchaeota archaeon]|nr:hypothetical protein [Candidatus Pacearchaeota archaeon]
MDNIDKLLEEKFMIGYFRFSVYPKFKVKIKEVIKKHNKEIKWIFKEEESRDENGDKVIRLELYTDKGSLNEFSEKRAFFIGLIENIFEVVGLYLDEDTATEYNKNFIGIASGKDFIDLKNVDINVKNNITYYYISCFGERLYFLGDVNKIIEAEKKYPKITEKIFGETVQSWYERNVEIIKKIFVNEENFKISKAIVTILEKNSHIRKIPYKLKKFRIAT